MTARPTRRDWCVRHDFQWGTNCCIKGFWIGGIDHGCIKGEMLTLAPDTCPTCDGRRTLQSAFCMWICRNCAGRGYVWPDSLVLRIAPFLCTGMRLHGLKEPCAVDKQRTIEMLDALVEVDDDE